MKKIYKPLVFIGLASLLFSCNISNGNSSDSNAPTSETISESTSSDSSNVSESSVTTSTSSVGNSFVYNAFTASEKNLFINLVGEVIPFVSNNEYYVEENEDMYGKYVTYYTFGNSKDEFNNYLSSLVNGGYILNDESKDEYGDTWYTYIKDEKVVIEISYYSWEGENVIDAYVYPYSDYSNNDGENTYSDFTQEEKNIFNTYIGEVIPFLPSSEYAIEGYYDFDDYENGVFYYTVGNTLEDFNNYRNLLLNNGYILTDQMEDEYGDTWYTYIKNDDIVIDTSFYVWEDINYIDVYVYSSLSSDGGDVGGDVGGDQEDVDLITNQGKGLPNGENGVYNANFANSKYVKSVADQGYYLDGCPTTGDVKVLVIPVEFSDRQASSLGYDLEKLNLALNGESGTTNYYSVSEYYKISSYGKLNLQFDILDEWFMPQNNVSYYENLTMDYYGSELEIGDQVVMDEALQYLEDKIDLSEYDSDNNQVIDAIMLISTVEIDENKSFNWAFRYWNLYTDENGYYYEYDGVSANDYLWASYQFILESYDEEGNVTYDSNTINPYTYIHEFGHVLGADDYYDTAYINEPLLGCDVMDSMNGDHNPFTKFNYGWLTSSRVVVADESVTLKLEDFSKNGDTIIIANNYDEELGAYQEYYVLMYYRSVELNGGDYGYFINDGVVMYHVNASLYREEVDGIVYYDIYNNNTDESDYYGTKDNLIEFVKSPNDTIVYTLGMSSSTDIIDDQGNKISYTFTIDSLNENEATITFTKNK